MVKQDAINRIEKIVQSLSLDRMPLKSEIESQDKELLDIIKDKYFAEDFAIDLDLSIADHRVIPSFEEKHWVDKKTYLKNKIYKCMEKEKISVLPTLNQLDNFYGNKRMSNLITKSGGLHSLAKEIGIPVRSSNTFKGRYGEDIAIDYLEGKGYSLEDMSTLYPYDLLVNGSVKIDVKTSNLYMNKKGQKMFKFGMEKEFLTSDLYFMIAIHNDKVIKKLIIPSCILNQKTLTIGFNSKWDQYEERTDLIDDYIEFFESISAKNSI